MFHNIALARSILSELIFCSKGEHDLTADAIIDIRSGGSMLLSTLCSLTLVINILIVDDEDANDNHLAQEEQT